MGAVLEDSDEVNFKLIGRKYTSVTQTKDDAELSF